MADTAQIEQALRNAHAAGDVVAARRLAAHLQMLRAPKWAPPTPEEMAAPTPGPYRSREPDQTSPLQHATRLFGSGMSVGTLPAAAAALGASTGMGDFSPGQSAESRYEQEKRINDYNLERSREAMGPAAGPLEIAGTVLTGSRLGPLLGPLSKLVGRGTSVPLGLSGPAASTAVRSVAGLGDAMLLNGIVEGLRGSGQEQGFAAGAEEGFNSPWNWLGAAFPVAEGLVSPLAEAAGRRAARKAVEVVDPQRTQVRAMQEHFGGPAGSGVQRTGDEILDATMPEGGYLLRRGMEAGELSDRAKRLKVAFGEAKGATEDALDLAGAQVDDALIPALRARSGEVLETSAARTFPERDSARSGMAEHTDRVTERLAPSWDRGSTDISFPGTQLELALRDRSGQVVPGASYGGTRETPAPTLVLDRNGSPMIYREGIGATVPGTKEAYSRGSRVSGEVEGAANTLPVKVESEQLGAIRAANAADDEAQLTLEALRADPRGRGNLAAAYAADDAATAARAQSDTVSSADDAGFIRDPQLRRNRLEDGLTTPRPTDETGYRPALNQGPDTTTSLGLVRQLRAPLIDQKGKVFPTRLNYKPPTLREHGEQVSAYDDQIYDTASTYGRPDQAVEANPTLKTYQGLRGEVKDAIDRAAEATDLGLAADLRGSRHGYGSSKLIERLGADEAIAAARRDAAAKMNSPVAWAAQNFGRRAGPALALGVGGVGGTALGGPLLGSAAGLAGYGLVSGGLIRPATSARNYRALRNALRSLDEAGTLRLTPPQLGALNSMIAEE